MLNPQMNSRGAVKHRPRPASVAEPTFSPDSLLERRGFELPVPLAKRVGLSGGTGGAAEAKKDCPESNLSCGGGPRVRILFPPGASQTELEGRAEISRATQA